MEFILRKADRNDVDEIMGIMRETQEDTSHPDWFAADNEEYILGHLQGKGFTIVAVGENEIAGFFVVKKPEPEENLGIFLDFSKEQCERVWIMDTAVVAKKWRGHGLQSRMLLAAEEELTAFSPGYLLCTVHPENSYSLNNMQNNGYKVMKKVFCYGGLERFVLMKEWNR